MKKTFKVEVEYDDDGVAMAGGNYGRTIRRAELLTVKCDNQSQVRNEVLKIFKRQDWYYNTLRRIGIIRELKWKKFL